MILSDLYFDFKDVMVITDASVIILIAKLGKYREKANLRMFQ